MSKTLPNLKKEIDMIRLPTSDIVMVGGLPTDIVIPVMGPSGVGKSTFINTLLGRDAMAVGHDMTSCTSKLQYEIVGNPPPLEGHRVIIVDTPGFDDTYVDDVQILRRIGVWLASSYNDKMKLGGVIYLHDITERRMRGTTRRNLDMFHQLCGDKALARVILGTTNWGEVDEKKEKLEGREKELATTFLKTMIDSGSKMLRFVQTKESAWAFLDAILGQFYKNEKIENDIPLQIQKEIVEHGRSIPETAAGQELKRHREKKKENDIAPQVVDLDRSIPETATGEELRYTLERHPERKKTDEAAEKITEGREVSMIKRDDKVAKKSWKKKDSMIRRYDNVMAGGLPTDIVILVMGPPGVGKSTFINTLLERDAMEVGHELLSCTSRLQYEIVDNPPPLEGHRVIIVDTPGFDDTHVDDVEILRRISVWLASSYNDKMKLGGVIYLQSILNNKMRGATIKNLDMFFQLCGHEALARVVLGTTNWGEVNKERGEEREQRLATTLWKTMIDSGSKMLRFDDTKESAWTFLNTIRDQLKFDENGKIKNDIALLIQKEIVEHGRSIPETAAGQKLRYTLKQRLELQKGNGIFVNAAALPASIEKQIDALHIPFTRKLFLSFLKSLKILHIYG